MIVSIRHRGLKRYFTRGDASRLPANYLAKITRILTALNTATMVEQMNISGYGLHMLTGNLNGFYAVKVTGNYRIIFRFEQGDAYDVDLVDYH